jgi:hypothetical protein
MVSVLASSAVDHHVGSSPDQQWKGGIIRGKVSLKGYELVVFYYLSPFEI